MVNSDIINIDVNHIKNQSLNIFPNPANNIVNINIKGNITNAVQVHLYNILGQEVMTYSITENAVLEINVEELRHGTYFAILKNGHSDYRYKKDNDSRIKFILQCSFL